MSRAALVAAYLALALVLTWPLALQLGEALPGYPNVDALDTLTLRGLAARMILDPGAWPMSDGVYFPAGYPVGRLMPNLLDHLSAAPFVLLLPFPLGENLWWLAVLAANGLAAHALGRQVGGSHAAGALAGVGFACSEPLLREANLLHGPQTMALWAPLYLAALLRLLAPEGRRRDALAAGLWMGLAGLTYWYNALFLTLGSLPAGLLALRRPGAPGRVALAALTAAAVAAPLLAPTLWSWQELPGADPRFAPAPLHMRDALLPVPEGLRFVVEQSASLAWPWQATPLDRSNLLSLTLALAAALGAWRSPRPLAAALLGLSAVGAVMILGPFLKLGEDPWLVNAQLLSLPGRWLAEAHPFFARLTWPQRWGLLIPLGLVALAARAPRPAWWAPLVLAEALLRSGNAPLQVHGLHDAAPWRALAAADGAVLELPLAREGLDAPIVGLHARLHGRPVVNPMLLPPGSSLPEPWRRWAREQPLIAYIEAFEAGSWPPDPGAEAVRAARDAGLAVIVVDATPGGVLGDGRVQRYVVGLGRHLGPPQDHGAFYAWWLKPPAGPLSAPPDGEAWRQRARLRRLDHPPPALDTLIEPRW